MFRYDLHRVERLTASAISSTLALMVAATGVAGQLPTDSQQRDASYGSTICGGSYALATLGCC